MIYFLFIEADSPDEAQQQISRWLEGPAQQRPYFLARPQALRITIPVTAYQPQESAMDNRSVREPLLISRPTASQQKALNQTVWNLREAITEAKPLEQIAGLGKAYLQLAANRQDDTPRLWNITDQTEGAPTLARLQTAPWYYLQLTDS